MADVGLTNAIRELTNMMRLQMGAPTEGPIVPGVGAHPFGGSTSAAGDTGAIPPGWLRFYDEISRRRNEQFEKITEEHVKGIKKNNDDFFERNAKLQLQLAPLYEGMHLFTKYAMNIPAQMMGGGTGRAARTGLDVSRDIGQMGFDIASAIATLVPGAGLGIGLGIQAVGRAGGSQILGDLFFRRGATEAGVRRTYMEDFEAKRWQNEESAMFAVKMGRLSVQAGAWGGPAIGGRSGLISGLVESLNEDPRVMQQAIAQAFKVGGAEGIKNIDRDSIVRLVTEGYGTASEVIAAQAIEGRYRYARGEAAGLANRTGLTLDQVLPLMQQTRMQYYMFGGGTAEAINRFVGNTNIGAINPAMGLQATAQVAQGAAGVTEEATSMLQFREFQNANPGSTYLDFVEAKRNGFADERWRRFVGGAAARFGAGGQMMRIAGGTILGGAAPGALRGIGETYAEGFADITRTGARRPAQAEAMARAFGGVSVEALQTNMDSIGKYVTQFGDEMGKFSKQMFGIVRDSADYVDAIIRERTKLSNEATSAALGAVGAGKAYERMDTNWMP